MAIQEFKVQNGVSIQSSTPFLIDEWDGPEVVFINNNYESKVDIIEGNTQITRDSEGPIYNPAQGDIGWPAEPSNPTFTTWNADGWDDLSDVTNRTYVTFQDVNSGGSLGNQIVGTEYIMYDTDNENYYTVKFTSWQNNAIGGAFSYVRRKINTSAFFTKTDGGSEVDLIADNGDSSLKVAITRDNNSGIYNPYVEGNYNDNSSPNNTIWNVEGWDDLSNVTARPYLNWYSAIKAIAGVVITDIDFVMKDTVNNEYWTIKFHHWTSNNNGGGFRYTRRKINVGSPPVGLKFNDGSIQSSAVTHTRLGTVPRSEIHDATYDYYLTRRDVGQFVILNQNCSVYIPDSKTCNLPIGTVFTLINMSGAECSVYKDNNNESGRIYNGAGPGDSTNGWGLNSQGIFTLIKIRQYYDSGTVVDWMIAGPNLDNYC